MGTPAKNNKLQIPMLRTKYQGKRMYKIVNLLLCCATFSTNTTEKPIMLKNIIERFKPAAAGIFSGAASAFVYAPFAYAQNQSAQGLKIDWKKIHHFWRGYHFLALNSVPTIGTQALAYALINNYIHDDGHNKNPNKKTTLAALLAGACAAPFTNACQLLTVHKQNTGLPLRTIINSFPHSYKSLGRGMLPTTLQGMLFVTTYTNALPFIKNKVDHYCGNRLVALVSSACLSSIILTATTQSLRVMATKLHADIHERQYKGLIDAAKQTIQTHGMKGMCIGATYRTAGNIIALPIINGTQQILNNIRI